jgi:hypothetical protein
VDTARDSPEDICAWREAESTQAGTYTVQPRSIAVLVAKASPRERP